MAYHELKTWPEYYGAVEYDLKKFEVRKDDRNFRSGDTLLLKEYNPVEDKYTGKELAVRVTYILEGGSFGVESGYVVMSIKKIV